MTTCVAKVTSQPRTKFLAVTACRGIPSLTVGVLFTSKPIIIALRLAELSHDLFDDAPVDVGEPELPALEAVSQPLVVDAE